MWTEDRHVHPHAHLHRQGRVERPACGRGSSRNKEGPDQQQGGGRHQPEAEVVHPREGHVGGSDHQGNLPVRETHEGRHDRAEHHHQTVHGGELVEELGIDVLKTRLKELGPDRERHDTTREQHDEAEPQVQRPDVLVVGGEQPATPSVGVVMRVVVVTGVVIQNCTHRWLLLTLIPDYLRPAVNSLGCTMLSSGLLPQALRV